MNDILFEVISNNKNIIPYRKELNKITGSVNASIVLNQLIYHASRNNYQPFYKFIEPCNNELYRKGDSWIEELGFTKYEFSTAYKKLDKLGIVTKKTNRERVTFYKIDRSNLAKLIKLTYEEIITIDKESSRLNKYALLPVSKDYQLSCVENTNIDNSKNKEQRLQEDDEEIYTIDFKYIDEYILDVTNNGKLIKSSFRYYKYGVIEALKNATHKNHKKTLRNYKDFCIESEKILESKPLDSSQELDEIVELETKHFIGKEFEGNYDIGIIRNIYSIGMNMYEVTYEGKGVNQSQLLTHVEQVHGKNLIKKII